MALTPTVMLAILAGLVLLGFCFQMLFNNGNADWAALAEKYPANTPFDGTWTEGHYDLGAPTDNSDIGKLGMAADGFYVAPKSGATVYVPFSQVQKAERIEIGEGSKPISYLTLDGDFKMSLPESFVKTAGDKLALINALDNSPAAS